MIDLHTHSTWSDGTLSPDALVELAARLKLEAVALCDHNTVEGLPEFLKAADHAGILGIPGVEFSTEHCGQELHILGLFVKPEDYSPITEMLEEMLLRKEESNRALVAALCKEGLELDYDAIRRTTPGGRVNRAVIAGEMVRKGYCGSVPAAFSQWLSPKRGYYVPPQRPDALQVIAFLRSLGCVSVLAHPFLNLKEGELRRFLLQAAAVGLTGMEVYYPKFNEAETALALQLTKEFGLLESGGSDFHGSNKPDIDLGTGRGNLNIPFAVLQRLQDRAGKA